MGAELTSGRKPYVNTQVTTVLLVTAVADGLFASYEDASVLATTGLFCRVGVA